MTFQTPSKTSRIEALAQRSRWLLIQGICMGSFLLFWLVGSLIGGSAMFGASQDHYYFVGQFGRLTEVPFGLWLYSWAHRPAASALGYVLPARWAGLWHLAVVWYENRLTAESRPPTPQDRVGIFASFGLKGTF